VIANLSYYTCAKNYQNRERFDKDIAKIKQCNFFASHGGNVAVSYGVEISTDYCFVTIHAFDRRTDRRTDVNSKTVRMSSQSHGN